MFTGIDERGVRRSVLLVGVKNTLKKDYRVNLRKA
jgi:hypothetical protein